MIIWSIILPNFFLYFWCTGIWGPHTPGKRAPPRASQFLELAKGSARSTSLIYKPTNPELVPQLPLYLTLTHQTNISPALNHPRARHQTTRNYLYSLKPTGYYSNWPILSCLPGPDFPTESSIKALAQICPSLLTPATWLRPGTSVMALCAICSPILGPVSK